MQMAFCTGRVSEHRERHADAKKSEEKKIDAVHAAAEHKIESIARAAFHRSANHV